MAAIPASAVSVNHCLARCSQPHAKSRDRKLHEASIADLIDSVDESQLEAMEAVSPWPSHAAAHSRPS